MKVAVVHDWLVTYAGAERVLEQILKLFPEADLYSLVDFLPDNQRDFIMHKKVHTSFIQTLPLARQKYRSYLPFMPKAIESFDMSGYDLIISSSHCVAKGVITKSNQMHICYIHTPVRYAWDLEDQYLQEAGLDKGMKGITAKQILRYIRKWDEKTANRVNYYVANSQYIKERVKKHYHRDASVIYPPVAVNDFTLCNRKEDFYVTASRMVPYKKMGLIVEAFSAMPDKKLIVIGAGPDFAKIKAHAGKNVVLLGYQPFTNLKDYMQRSKAFVFAAEEDFGITPVEAQACGTPVIAYGKGGALETVRGLGQDKPTGVFFQEQTVESMKNAIKIFEENRESMQSINCRAQAEKFGTQVFQGQFRDFIEDKFKNFR